MLVIFATDSTPQKSVSNQKTRNLNAFVKSSDSRILPLKTFKYFWKKTPLYMVVCFCYEKFHPFNFV